MNKVKIFIGLIMLSIMVSCSGTQKIETITIPAERLPLNIDSPAPLSLEVPTYYIINYEGKTYLAITIDDFKKLSSNSELIQGFIQKQQHVIGEYRNYYESGRAKEPSTRNSSDTE